MQAKMATEGLPTFLPPPSAPLPPSGSHSGPGAAGDRQDEVVEGGQEDALVEWVQEWSKTLVFAAGLPLPLSIQVPLSPPQRLPSECLCLSTPHPPFAKADAIPGGTRLSFIAVNNPGSIQAVAALEFVILPRVPEVNEHPWRPLPSIYLVPTARWTTSA